MAWLGNELVALVLSGISVWADAQPPRRRLRREATYD